MPKLVKVPLNDGELHLVAVFGMSQVRLGLVKVLGAHSGPMTTSALMDEMGGLQLVTLLRHLTALEEAGVVSSSAPAGERQGRTVIWQLDRDRLRTEIEGLLSLLG